MKVAIADDHALVRDGLAMVLKSCEGIDAVLEAVDFEDLQRVLDQNQDVGLVLLDINMGTVTTVGMVEILHEQLPDALIAILSVHEDPAMAAEFLNNGCVGYIPKSASNDVLLNAVRLILAGSIYIPPFMVTPSQPLPDTAGKRGTVRLTRRQQDVLAFMVQGNTNKGIADALNLSESTVKAHVSSILDALGVSNRVQATNEAVRLGMVSER